MKRLRSPRLLLVDRLTQSAAGMAAGLLLMPSLTFTACGAEAQDQEMSGRAFPKDYNIYTRNAVPEDIAPFGAPAAQGAFAQGQAQVFVADPIVNNVNPNLITTDPGGWSEPSIAVNPQDGDEIVLHGGFSSWNGNEPLFHSTDGGQTWSLAGVITPPPLSPGTAGCPCDTAIDYGRGNLLSGTFLSCVSDGMGGCSTNNVYTGTTGNPDSAAAWNWLAPGGVAQITSFNAPDNTDQPWVLVNRDPFSAAQDNVYVAYDDFGGGPDMRVSVSYGANPPNFTADNQSGSVSLSGGSNPGHRLAVDPRTGYVYSLFQGNVVAGPGGSVTVTYMLNRSTDGGVSWSLNGSGSGIGVAVADSNQRNPKFGTVNALIGGVDHAAVDPISGDVYYVYGNRDAGTGNNRLAIRRLTGDGAGGLNVGPERFVTGQVQAALPAAAVTENRVVGVLYDTFDGFSSDGFPIFTAHFAYSTDQGQSFTDIVLLTFLSPATDSGNNRQRVLGDYQQMKAVGNTFYGVFAGNGVPFGRPNAVIDPIFFKVTVDTPTITIPSDVFLADTCVGTTSFGTLYVCNTGTADLEVGPITSDNPRFSVITPSSGYPVVISPDFCFPFRVSFAPTMAGEDSAILEVPSNDPMSPTNTVQAFGTGLAPSVATFLPNSGDFGDVCVGSFLDLPLTINNPGGCTLVVTNVVSSSSQFVVPVVVNYPITIHPGDSVAIPIRFQPSSLGSKSGQIFVQVDYPVSPLAIQSVSGNSPSGDVRVTGSTDFGDVCAGGIVEKTLSVCNVGKCNLSVLDVSFVPDCDDFILVNNPFPAVVSPDSCVNVVIRFTPTSCGSATCNLRVVTDDPDTPVINLPVTANTPCASIDVPPDVGFPPTVISSFGPCRSLKPFPISNTGTCPLVITDITIGGPEAGDYSLEGLPSFPIILEPGHIVGEGDLNIAFAPAAIDRDREATITVTYVSNPVSGATANVVRKLCGEGVNTGARVLVMVGGIPIANVEKIQLQRINANRNKKPLDTHDVTQDAPLTTVVPNAPCAPFQYHREYGTVSNPIQLLAGSYQVTVSAIVNGKRKSQTVGFDVSTCDFNPTIVINY